MEGKIIDISFWTEAVSTYEPISIVADVLKARGVGFIGQYRTDYRYALVSTRPVSQDVVDLINQLELPSTVEITTYPPRSHHG